MTKQKLAEQKKLQRLEQAWLEERDAEMWAISRVIPTFKPITLVVRYMMRIYLFLKFKVKHIIFKYGNGYNCLVNLPLPCKWCETHWKKHNSLTLFVMSSGPYLLPGKLALDIFSHILPVFLTFLMIKCFGFFQLVSSELYHNSSTEIILALRDSENILPIIYDCTADTYTEIIGRWNRHPYTLELCSGGDSP